MKRTFYAVLACTALIGVLFSSCGNTVSTNPTLKNEKDSISYALGAFLYNEQRLGAFINEQSGLVTDTLQTYMDYTHKIASDSTNKAALQKEMKMKIDSIKSANEKNIAEFMRGFSEGVNATKAKEAYITGLAIGNNISQSMISNMEEQLYGPDSKEKIDRSLFLSGMTTALKNKKLQIDNSGQFMDSIMKAGQAKRLDKEFGEWKAQNTKFLEDNKTKEGVVVLASGVQYKVEKEGKGAKPTAADKVKVNYHGTLIDGTVFDSSVSRGEPATFGVGQVIPGWTEVLQLMPVGSKWTVYIPQDKAYGTQNMGTIKPFSTLIFEIELLDIVK